MDRWWTKKKFAKSSERVSIKVSRETLETLKRLRKHPRETIESVILRLIVRYRGEEEPLIIIH